MAVDITITFTDAQWKMIEEHFPNYVEDEGGRHNHQAITEEELKVVLFDKIQFDVVACVKANSVKEATESADACFDV